ncbi:MAG: Crp/Fnr family transcriptional regulator [Acidobacteria bacterium]|nr:Crp/Fnr family transcriptional regulator [Acidobacteriota bacterium]
MPRIVWPGDFVQDRVPVTTTHFSTARAAEACTLAVMPAAECEQAAEQEPEFRDWLLRQSDRQILELERRIQWILTDRADARVIDTLVNLAKRALGGRPEAVIPLTQADLAKLSGNSRETTSTVLGSLRRNGLIEYRQRRVLIPSIDRLRAQAATAGAVREEQYSPEWNQAEQQT